MWEKLNLHLEHLLPGFVTFFLVYLIGGSSDAWEELGQALAGGEFTATAIVISCAYILGVLASSISRPILDGFSASYLRPVLLRRVLGRDLQKTEANRRYREALTVALATGNESVVTEILKRREAGRLLRSSLIPVLLAWLHVVLKFDISWCWGLLVAAGVFGLLGLFYASSEMAIFYEARLHGPAREASDRPLS